MLVYDEKYFNYIAEYLCLTRIPTQYVVQLYRLLLITSSDLSTPKLIKHPKKKNLFAVGKIGSL